MTTLFLRLFVLGGLALLALLWFGSADDAGDGGGEGDGEGVGAAAALLSVRGLLAAMTVGGAVGAFALGVLRVPVPVALGLSAIGAYGGFRFWRAALRRMNYFDRDHSASPELLLGREGVLTVTAHSRESPGIVQVTLGGLSQEYTAVTEGGILPEGARVVIMRIESPSTVVVGPSPFPELPPTP